MLSRRRLLGTLPGALLALREMRGEAAKRRHMKQRWDHRKVIVVENRAGKEWNQAVEFVAGEWHRAFPRLRYRVIHRPSKRCRRVPGRIVICPMAYNGMVAGFSWQARSKEKKREIDSANIRIMRTPLWRVASAEYIWNGQIARNDMVTLCHEFGHAIGLEHYDEWRNSCMGGWSPIGVEPTVSMVPAPYDADSLRLLYKRKGPGWP